MTRYLFILLVLAFSFLLSCSGSKKSAAPVFPKVDYIAWNEDTILSYQFTLHTDNRFSYVITRKGSLIKKDEFYHGIFKNRPDTLFLFFHKDLKPKGIAGYLVKEASGNYLIQYFTDGRSRMFLRIKLWNTRF